MKDALNKGNKENTNNKMVMLAPLPAGGGKGWIIVLKVNFKYDIH